MRYKNIHFIQKALSYLFPITLDKKKSKWSENVSLKLNNGALELSTENAVYSYGKNYYAFAEAYKKLNISQYPIKKVLILGLGMGSIIEILEGHFKSLEFHGVETDSVIIDLFKKHIEIENDFSLKIYENDAYEYVKDCENKFDLINIDIFIDDVIPHPFHDHEFLENIKSNLTNNGIVLFNRLDSKAAYRQYNKTYWNEVFNSIFPNSKNLKIRGNVILAGFNC